MLVVKCPQCARSYRLAESLYRRKAAGYGVVITCRHCKTQIHVDEGALPPPTGDADVSAQETVEGDTANPPDVAEHDAATRSDPNAADPETIPPTADVDAATNPPAADLDAATNPPTADMDAVTNPPTAGTGRAPAINLKAADANEVAAAVAAIEAAVERMGATPAAPSAENGSSPTNPIVPPVVAKNDTGTPALPKVAPKPAAFAPRPAGSPPRPAGSPPRPGGSATATPMPGGSATATPMPGGSATATPMPGGSATATPMPGKAMPLVVKKPHTEAASSPGNPKPKLVALSPGLLGVGTAPKPPSPKSALATDQAPAAPMSVPDSALFEVDAEPLSQPPDSTMPIDTLDYVESERPAALAPKAPPPRDPPRRDGADVKPKADAPAAEAKPEKRLPQAPPTRKQHAAATAGEPKPDEIPSETGTPKMAEIALGSSPLPLSQKKGEPKRKPQPSGDLTDDLLGTDIAFDAPPALAPPDAAALARAPISSRRPAAGSKADSVKPGAQASTKAPVSSSKATEKKSSGRGFVLVLLAAALGGGVYFFRQRLPDASEPSRPEAAVNAPAVKEPEPAPVAEPPAATGTEAAPSTAPPTPEASAAAPTAATTTTAGATATSTTTEVAPSTTAAKTPAARPSTTTSPAPTAEKQVATPTPTPAPTPTPTAKSTAAIEPRGSVGTEPFDVAAARSALEASAGQASGCRKPGDPSGVAVVTITFSQTGRVTTANISGPPFQATPTGGCIASTMRKTRVPAFAGDMVTVRKTITVQ